MGRAELKARIVESVDPGEFYKKEAGISSFNNGARVRCFHPDHQDPNPSMTINSDGSFRCFGCGARGSTIVQAYEFIKELDYEDALAELAEKYLEEHYIPERKIEKWHQRLMEDRERREFLGEARGIDHETITKYKLGWNGVQFTIPIQDDTGLYANVRKYNPNSKSRKVVSYKKGFGKARLWPLEALDSQDVVLVEGEMDALCGRAHGLNCITSTGGASHWKEAWTPHFKNRNVVLIPDTDKAGVQWGQMVGEQLLAVASSVKIVKLPLAKGEKDLTDFLLRLSVADLEEVIQKTEYSVVNVSPPQRLQEEVIGTTLAEASQDHLYFKATAMDCMVSGKELSPYLAPVKVKVDCKGGRDMCEMCHRKPKGFTDTLEFDLETDLVLKLVDTSDANIEKVIRKEGSIPKDCPLTLHHLEKSNVERITLSPGIEEQGDQNIAATGYFIGHGIETNRPYRVEGFLLPEPRRQRAVHIVTSATSVFDALDSFELSADLYERLRRFQSDDPQEWLREYYSSELPKVTGIEGRKEMHQAVDLVYHSVLGFTFNNEHIQRGWLEALLFGDTQQGKTSAAYNLVSHYKLGHIATGEASTFAGLVGGLQKINDRWAVSWGLLARHDRRLCFIDEVSGLSVADIERMSRVRSEGKAELVKVVSQTANARCRLIWLGNSRVGAHLNSYSSGIEAIKELIGKNEDISRFDFVVTMARGEVNDAVLNKRRAKNRKLKYSADDERSLILWCWSRKPDQVRFTKGAERAILEKHAPELSRDYSSEFPLIQKENIRVKVARVSAAVAGRVFRTSDGQTLMVDELCVEEAVRFIRELCDRESLGYRMFTEQARRARTLRDEAAVRQELESFDTVDEILEGLNEYQELNVSDMADFAGVEKWEAKELLGFLVRQRALSKKAGVYRKRPAFISLIKGLQAQRLTSRSKQKASTKRGSKGSSGS